MVALDESKSRISEYKKRGMPMEIGKAKIWHKANVVKKPRGDKKWAGIVLPSPGQREPGDLNAWPARLKRARDTERQTSALLQGAIKKKESAQIPGLLKAHSQAVEAVAAAEKLAASILSESGDLIHRDSVRAVMTKLLTPLREALDKLPLGERTNCNPQQPEIAERALTEWRDRLLGRMAGAEGKF